MRILKVNTYAPDGPLYQAFGPDVTFDVHRGNALESPPSAESCRLADAVINCSATIPINVDPAAFRKCRIVVREGVGYDTVDLKAWGERGIPVCNVPDYGTTEVADHALALALTLTRGTASYSEALRDDPAGNWNFRVAPLVRRQKGLTFGVVGLGRIGLTAARRAAAFDMKVIFCDPYLPNGVDLATGYERVRTLADLAARSDIVSIHAPLSDETRGMIGRDFFAAAKDGMLLVNTARGPIIDLDALFEALKSGKVGGAGIDVLPVEPADAKHPLIAAFKAREPWLEGRLVLTPHAAFFSPSALDDMQRKAIEVAVNYLRDGELMNCVNREYLRK
jgi:D-3-phosphoglycerate dehydrogenase/C-terminal binding protein